MLLIRILKAALIVHLLQSQEVRVDINDLMQKQIAYAQAHPEFYKDLPVPNLFPQPTSPLPPIAKKQIVSKAIAAFKSASPAHDPAVEQIELQMNTSPVVEPGMSTLVLNAMTNALEQLQRQNSQKKNNYKKLCLKPKHMLVVLLLPYLALHALYLFVILINQIVKEIV
jgi:hypothetical protein